MISKSQIEQYNEEGYTIVEGVFNMDELNPILNEFEEIVEGSIFFPKHGGKIGLETPVLVFDRAMEEYVAWNLNFTTHEARTNLGPRKTMQSQAGDLPKDWRGSIGQVFCHKRTFLATTMMCRTSTTTWAMKIKIIALGFSFSLVT